MTLSVLRVVKEYLVMAKFKTITTGPERQFLIASEKHQFPNNKNDCRKNVYQQANLHGPNITWSNSNKLMFHK